jgi:hypothetical protein
VEDQSALSESVVLCPVPNTIPLANWVCLIGQIGPESGDPEGIMGAGPGHKTEGARECSRIFPKQPKPKGRAA